MQDAGTGGKSRMKMGPSVTTVKCLATCSRSEHDWIPGATVEGGNDLSRAGWLFGVMNRMMIAG